MGFSWTYLTRRFLLQNHRDYIAMMMIGCWGAHKFIHKMSTEDDESFVMHRIYTDDETDISYRDPTNKTDGAVRRKLILEYAEKIRQLRAEKERAAQLDAYNYLNGTNLQL